MIGISYFAMAQLEAAVERPPHLRAIFPVAVTTDLYEAAMHHGLFSSSFVTPFLAMVGLTSARSDAFWRSELVDAARGTSCTPRRCTGRFAHHERRVVGRPCCTPRSSSTTTRTRGTTCGGRWRSSTPCATTGGTSATFDRCSTGWRCRPTWGATGRTSRCTSRRRSRRCERWRTHPVVRVGMLGEFGLTWPWESLHVEALAWFDHWLKGHDTGILEGPPIRYWMPGADEWRTSDVWPPADRHPSGAGAARRR